MNNVRFCICFVILDLWSVVRIICKEKVAFSKLVFSDDIQEIMN